MLKILGRLLTLPVLGLLLLAGCSSAQPAATGTTTPGATSAAPGQGAAGPTPKRGGTLINLKAGGPNGFDPYLTLNWQSSLYSMPVFSKLVRIDPLKGNPVTAADIVPDLAERWEFSKDGKEMTFYLRKGVKWHNGTPFTAKDVKYSVERMADPKLSFFAGDLADMASVQVIDDLTVKVMWKVPANAKIGVFASGFSVILSADYHPTKDRKKEDFAMGTGPFKLTSFMSQAEYKYERNPDYYIKDRPYLDGLIFRVVTSQAQLPAMISGQGDMCHEVRACISAPEQEETLRQKAPQLKIWMDQKVPRPLGRAVYFNLEAQGPWQNVDVRRALALVIDRDSSVGVFGKNYAVPLTWTQGMGYDIASADKLIGWDKPLAARITEAKALMAKAGYANGFKATGMARAGEGSGGYLDHLVLVAEAWKKHLGVDIKIDAPEVATEVEKRSRFDYQILLYVPTMRTVIHPSEMAGQFVCGAPENWARYCNKELDAIFSKMAGLADGKELTDLAKQAEAILLKDLPGIPLFQQIDVPVTKADVMGIVGQPYTSNEDYLTIWLNR